MKWIPYHDECSYTSFCFKSPYKWWIFRASFGATINPPENVCVCVCVCVCMNGRMNYSCYVPIPFRTHVNKYPYNRQICKTRTKSYHTLFLTHRTFLTHSRGSCIAHSHKIDVIRCFFERYVSSLYFTSIRSLEMKRSNF